MSTPVRAATLFYYALPAIPIALLGLPLYIYLPTFYAQTVGLGVGAVGAILLAARLLDMLTDPLFGLLSDRVRGRKLLMAAGALLMLGAFSALVHPPQDAGAGWLLLFSVLVYTGWSLLNIPYLALNAEISPEYHEKTRLSAAREIGAILGVVLALTLPYLYGIADAPDATLRLLWQTLLLLIPFTVLTALYGVPDPRRLPQSSMAVGTLYARLRQHPGMLRLMGAYFINNLANAFPATLFLFFVDHVLGAADHTGILLLIYFLSGLAALPLWTLLARRTGKRRAWLLSMTLASAAFIFVPFLGAGDLVWFMLICAVSGLSLGADMALPAALQSDAAEAAQMQGERVSGALFGLWSMLTKLALAASVGIAFGILALAGFTPDAPPSASLLTLSLLYGALPVVLKLCTLFILRRFHESR